MVRRVGIIINQSRMKTIPLTRDKFAIVDDADYEYLNQFKWHYHGYYASRTEWIKGGKGKFNRIYMHREILDTPFNMLTDHINRDRLDNRRENLRIATSLQNIGNADYKHGVSGMRGVRISHNKSNPYRAILWIKNKPSHLGYYKTLKEAAKAYNNAAKIHFGEFATLNQI